MSELTALAARAGIHLRWSDVHGTEHTVAPATLEHLLGVLGYPSGDAAERAESAQRLAQRDAAVPALSVARSGERLALGVPHQSYALHDAGGIAQAGRLDEHGSVRLDAAPGYYRLLYGAVERQVALAPNTQQIATRRLRRVFGLIAQLYGLRRPGDSGLGDYEALARLAEHAGRRGAEAIAISPDHAGFARAPERASPYAPSSRLFHNALHIDPGALLGPTVAASLLADLGAAERAHALERADRVDWRAAGTLRWRLLRSLFERAASQVDTWSTFTHWRAQAGATLERHACFEALDATHAGRPWPAQLRDAHAAPVAAFAAEHAHEVSFHAFVQWLAEQGATHAQARARAAGMQIGLIADLAIGVDPAGSDAWQLSDWMLRGATIGAPPDLLAPLGQNWGLTTYAPHALRTQGYAPYRELVRRVLAPVGGMRVDHVLGVQRLWLVPDGAPASDGAYVSYPRDDLLGILALESWLGSRVVIGEDLGTVPEGFRDALASHGILGMSVLLFERDAAGFLPAPSWRADAAGLTTTHDLPTLAGWSQHRDLQWRYQLAHLDGAQLEAAWAERDADHAALHARLGAETASALTTELIVDRAIDHVASTPAPLVLIPLEDLAAEVEQPNLPGTTEGHPNWQRRADCDVDRLLDRIDVARRMASLSTLRPRMPDDAP